MARSGSARNCFTYPLVIKSCAKVEALAEGREVHCFLIKDGFGANSYAATSLIEMYEGFVGDARKVFDEMPHRNVVAWTAMISAHIFSGDMGSARSLFEIAPTRDVVLWNKVVAGFSDSGDVAAARELFDAAPAKDLMAWNTMLNGYAKNGLVSDLESLFEAIPMKKNVFSWNALIGGYSKNGRFSEVLSSFERMLVEKDEITPNDATITTVLSACGRLGALDLGTWCHAYSDNLGYKSNVFVQNALVDMYAKCGSIESAIKVFEGMMVKDVVSWNSMLCGLAAHGRAHEALGLFRQMGEKPKPDGVTFVGVLSACAHLGLVEKGVAHFRSMGRSHGIQAQIEHYGCVVDLLSRAGHLERAVGLIEAMPVKPDAVVWAAVLGGCKVHKNVEIAEVALRRLVEIEPRNPANYVMLANVYGDLRRWRDAARLKVAMRDTGFRKVPACSLIEVDRHLAEFCSMDERHPKTEEIYEALEGITRALRSFGDAFEEENHFL